MGDKNCKDALYSKCETDSRLNCTWLDAFFNYQNVGGAFHLPHQKDINDYLFEDCRPAPPCSCHGLAFDGKDPVKPAYECCRDLKIHCKRPFSGLDCKAVESVCSNDEASTAVKSWVQHANWHAKCTATIATRAYEFEAVNTDTRIHVVRMSAESIWEVQQLSPHWRSLVLAACGGVLALVFAFICRTVGKLLLAKHRPLKQDVREPLAVQQKLLLHCNDSDASLSEPLLKASATT